jgi:hypothetical protein
VNTLSPEQFRDLEEARKRSKPIRSAITVAKFDGITVALFGGLTLLSAAFGSIWGLVLGAGMCIIAYIELQGAQRLRRLDVKAPKTLALNQIFLGGLLLSYAIYSIFTAGSIIDATLREAGPDVANMFGNDIKSLAQSIAYLIYGSLAAVAIFGQGGTALFYLSRRKHIEAYLAQTPPWIIQAQQAGMPM